MNSRIEGFGNYGIGRLGIVKYKRFEELVNVR
jgi:hypothetical protein